MDLSAKRDELLTLSLAKLGASGAEQVATALAEAELVHAVQVRKSDGAPYVTHCIDVARLCLEWGLLDPVAVSAALLHDTVEDAPKELGMEERLVRFGPEVTALVQALSKIRDLRTGSGDLPATYRRILQAASKDLRVLLIKAFDQFDNAATLYVHQPEKAQEKAGLCLIYVGVARRLGILSFANALVERALPYLLPQKSKLVQQSLKRLQVLSRDHMDRLDLRIRALFPPEEGVTFAIEPKEIGDYFYLTERLGVGQLLRVGHPVYRLVLGVEEDDQAWRVLGRLHRHIGPMPRHVRDYMNAPRVNGFKALTTRILWEGLPVTVQITRRADELPNRLGVLAEWGVSGPDPNRYMRLLATLGDSDLRMTEVQSHVLPDMLDIYTPKGDRFTFPQGAVVVDFAFLVHTDLGEHCAGAMVNGTPVGPDELLNDGDVVQVLTSPKARPQRAWLEVVKTARAKTLIKQALKHRDIPVSGVLRTGDDPTGGQFVITDLTGPDMIWSTCCLPVPNDSLLGRLTSNGDWEVHVAGCPRAASGEWQTGGWQLANNGEILSVSFSVDHCSGALLPVVELLAKRGINGHSIRGKGFSEELYHLNVEFGGRPTDELGRVLKELPTIESVREIRRFFWHT